MQKVKCPKCENDVRKSDINKNSGLCYSCEYATWVDFILKDKSS